MFDANTPQDTRAFFFETWEKHQRAEPLSPLEAQILDVILAHPEYHVIFKNKARSTQKAYFSALGDVNPFLHMGLHLALREQLSTNRPAGIKAAYERLSLRLKDPLAAEHLFMQCLENCLFTAQQHKTAPDEKAYLQACLALV